TAIFFAAIMYYKYYGVIVTYKALAQVGQVFQVRASVMNLTDPYYTLMFADIVLMSALYFFNKRFKIWAQQAHTRAVNRKLASVILAVAVLACYANVVSNSHIYNEIKKAEKMGLINYEVYEIVSAILPNAGGGFNVTLDEIRSLKGIEPIAADELEH